MNNTPPIFPVLEEDNECLSVPTSPSQLPAPRRLFPEFRRRSPSSSPCKTFPKTSHHEYPPLPLYTDQKRRWNYKILSTQILILIALCTIALRPPITVVVPPNTISDTHPSRTLREQISEQQQDSSLAANNNSETKTYPTEIRFLGERHSGTNWMFEHLSECFGDDIFMKSSFARWKHWFQYDPPDKKNILVIAQFRDPYAWVEAMRKKPHHSPNHVDLDWKEFVTRPWTVPQAMVDAENGGRVSNKKRSSCLQGFKSHEIFPCKSPRNLNKRGWWPARYELRRDRPGQPYDSIVDLRRDKNLNFLEIADYESVSDFMLLRYEDQVQQGTAKLIKEIEEKTGIQAKCTPYAPSEPRKKNEFDPEYISWMNEHVDWEVENRIGYMKRTH